MKKLKTKKVRINKTSKNTSRYLLPETKMEKKNKWAEGKAYAYYPQQSSFKIDKNQNKKLKGLGHYKQTN